jgi:hypothetical protein
VSAGDVGMAADALTGAFEASSASVLHDLIEALPEFCQVLREGMARLDEEVTGMGGSVLQRTGGATAELAQHAAAMATAAEEAALAFPAEARFWLE